MTSCKYNDCGFCYAPDDVETSASSQSACFDPDYCPYLKSQMTDLDIIKECRQTGRTRTTTKKLLEKAYETPMTKNEEEIEKGTPMKPQMLDAYTDYPIEGLGDIEFEKAPIRKCTILTWDRNKYCDVLVYFVDKDGELWGHVTNFKQFYLYKNKARIDDGVQFTDDELQTLPWTY